MNSADVGWSGWRDDLKSLHTKQHFIRIKYPEMLHGELVYYRGLKLQDLNFCQMLQMPKLCLTLGNFFFYCTVEAKVCKCYMLFKQKQQKNKIQIQYTTVNICI